MHKGTPGPGKGPVKLEAADLHRRCLKGDEDAWRSLFGWCLVKAAKTLPQEAESVAQQVCLKLLEGGLERVQNPKAFLGYVSRATTNEVINRLRARRGNLSLDQPLSGTDDETLLLGHTVADESDLPEEQAAARLLLRRLNGALDELPAYCGGVMRQYVRYRMGLVESYKEMAKLLGVSVNTLGVQIKRCLDQLRALPVFAELLADWNG